MQSQYNVNDISNQQGKAYLLISLFALAMIIVTVIVATLTYRFSYQKGYHVANEEAQLTVDGINSNLKDGFRNTEQENELLQKEIEAAKQERDISLSNLAELRVRIDDLKTTNLQLQQTLELYGKNISKQGGIPLQIIAAKIDPLPEGVYEYRFDVLQLPKNNKSHTLYPKLSLLNHTSFVDIPLETKTYDIKGIARIRGRFVMPKGFKPLQIKLKISAGSENIEQLYNWRLGKRKNNMPLSLAEVPEVDRRPITKK